MGLGGLFQSGLQGLGSLFGGGGGGGGLGGLLSLGASLFGFQDGGLVRGPGTGRSDSILARISNGEYIVNAAATRRYGPILEAINSGRIPRFQEGGLAGEQRDSGGGFGNTVNVSLQVTGSVDQATRRAVREMGDELTTIVQTGLTERRALGER